MDYPAVYRSTKNDINKEDAARSEVKKDKENNLYLELLNIDPSNLFSRECKTGKEIWEHRRGFTVCSRRDPSVVLDGWV